MAEYIEREALLNLYVPPEWFGEEWDALRVPIPVVRQNILDQPAADVAPVVHGRWEWKETGPEDYEQYWACSVCGKHQYWESNYCPNCGAKMNWEVGG